MYPLYPIRTFSFTIIQHVWYMKGTELESLHIQITTWLHRTWSHGEISLWWNWPQGPVIHKSLWYDIIYYDYFFSHDWLYKSQCLAQIWLAIGWPVFWGILTWMLVSNGSLFWAMSHLSLLRNLHLRHIEKNVSQQQKKQVQSKREAEVEPSESQALSSGRRQLPSAKCPTEQQRGCILKNSPVLQETTGTIFCSYFSMYLYNETY